MENSGQKEAGHGAWIDKESTGAPVSTKDPLHSMVSDSVPLSSIRANSLQEDEIESRYLS
jgi:hypothetical protein